MKVMNSRLLKLGKGVSNLKEIVGLNPMKNPLLHDLSEIQKIKRDIVNDVDNLEFKKKISSKPRRKKKIKR